MGTPDPKPPGAMRVLIISPFYPPVNTPDMHRIRISIPIMRQLGHEVMVVAVRPGCSEAETDPVLEDYYSDDNVIKVGAFPSGITRKFGLGNLGYRSFFQYRRSVKRILKDQSFDLVYFSTTVFPVMALGPYWKRKFKIPFVLDMQDPWRNDFYLSKPRNERPPKYWIAHAFNTVLERYTMKRADGIISVSPAYPDTLRKRYHSTWPSEVIPFSASSADFDLVRRISLENPLFIREAKVRYVVYTGAVTPGMPVPIRVMLHAFKNYISVTGDKAIRLLFVGTTYEKGEGVRPRVLPVAEQAGMGEYVQEHPGRVGYFHTIKVLLDADLIIFPGSLDAGYTASKIFPYVLSEKPVFAVSHEKSSTSSILRECNTGPVVTFSGEKELLARQNEINNKLAEMLSDLPSRASIDFAHYNKYSEETMARKQVAFFSKILESTHV